MYDFSMKNNFLLVFKNLYYLIILVIILLISEGVYYFYYNEIMDSLGFKDYNAKTGYSPIIWNENGIIEYLQIFLLLASIFLLILFVKEKFVRINFLEKLLIILYLLGLNYYFFEEISWGQHFFGWESSAFFLKINHQGETNLHNVSSIFNELPRNMLFVWCSLTFLWIDKISFKRNFIRVFLFPNKNLKYISFLILFFFIPDFLIDKLNFVIESLIIQDNQKIIQTILNLISFNFIRLSELEELLFNIYILTHAYYLLKSRQLI